MTTENYTVQATNHQLEHAIVSCREDRFDHGGVQLTLLADGLQPRTQFFNGRPSVVQLFDAIERYMKRPGYRLIAISSAPLVAQ